MTQAVAFGTGAHRIIERKQARLQLGNRVIATRLGAGEFRAEQLLGVAVHIYRQRAPFGQTQRGFKALGEALFQVGAYFHAIHHHLDGVFIVFLERG